MRGVASQPQDEVKHDGPHNNQKRNPDSDSSRRGLPEGNVATVGQKFAPHFDGFFRRSNGERSQLTFMVYLNADFTGGETKFYGEDRQLRVAS
jgi:hypothetical protein